MMLPILMLAFPMYWVYRQMQIRRALKTMAHHAAGNIETRIAWYQEIGRSNMLIVGVTGDDRIVIGGPNPRISHVEG